MISDFRQFGVTYVPSYLTVVTNRSSMCNDTYVSNWNHVASSLNIVLTIDPKVFCSCYTLRENKSSMTHMRFTPYAKYTTQKWYKRQKERCAGLRSRISRLNSLDWNEWNLVEELWKLAAPIESVRCNTADFIASLSSRVPWHGFSHIFKFSVKYMT